MTALPFGRTEPGPVFVTQRELAGRWRLSVRTLERWRGERYGPAWLVIGGSIRYRFEDVLAYEQAYRFGE